MSLHGFDFDMSANTENHVRTVVVYDPWKRREE